MANGNFVVQNGLTIGPLTIDAATGSITTTGNINAVVTSTSETIGTLTANTIVAGNNGTIILTGNIIPSANLTYDLGSLQKQFHSVYVGPGTLYINGTPVLGASTTGTPTINMTASAGQNISVATNGGGILQLDGGAAGAGYIQIKSPLQMAAGYNITSSDGNAIQFANQIGVDSITSHSANTNFTITAQGTGKVAINTDTIITGNLTVNGVTETINTTNLLVSDQYAVLNNGVTGTPTLDAGIRINRGTSNNAVLKWTESVQAWQISSDNTTYGNIATQSYVSSAISAATPSASTLTGTTLASTIVNSSLTSVGTLANLTVTNTITGSVSGNAGTATKLATARTIALTGDATASGSFDGSANYSQAVTLATVNSNVGSFGNATTIPVITVNAKGLVTAVSTASISGALTFTGDVTGTGSTGGSTALTIASGAVTNAKLQYSTITHSAGTGISISGGTTSLGGTVTITNSGVTSLSSGGHITASASTGSITLGSDATSSNTAGTIVARDGSGNFSAGTVSATATTAQYADLAENYQGDKAYAPGTVVMFGGDQEVTVADADTRAVAGVVSTNPAHLMNGGLNGANVVPVALQGRVPCMVIGPVKKGDMLVSAGYGYAKSSANPQMGQVIGKALYDFPGNSKAVIEVVVGRI